MPFCTRADVEAILGGDDLSADDALISSLIALVQGEMEGPRGAGRPLEADDYTETFDPSGDSVYVSNPPINSVVSVTEDGTVLAADEFIAGARRIRRVQAGRPARWKTWKLQTIEVAYNGGYATVPADLRKACAQAVARLFREGVQAAASLEVVSAGGSPGGIRRVALEGSDEIEYFEATAQAQSEAGPVTSHLTDAELATARAYRVWGVG